MKKMKHVVMLILALFTLTMASIPAFASCPHHHCQQHDPCIHDSCSHGHCNHTVKVTIRDKKSGHKVTYKVKCGNKLSRSQIGDAKNKIGQWFDELCDKKDAKERGMGVEYSKRFKAYLPKSAKTRTFTNDTTINVKYKKTRTVIRYVDTVTRKIFKRTYLKKGKKVPYFPNPPFHEGYVFKSWAGIPQGRVIRSCRVITEKAMYVPITYTVKYTGGYGAKGSMQDQKDVKYDQTFNLRTNSFTKQNSVFVGWRTPSGSILQNGQQVKNLTSKSGTVTLTAVWQDAPLTSYPIHYILNGGTNPGNPSTYTRNDSIYLKNPTKRAYEFLGWSGTGISGLSKNVIIPQNSTGERTYTANWGLVSYTVYFDANGGVGKMDPISAISSAEFKLPNNTFTKARYSFAGWSDGNGNTYRDGEVVKDILVSKNYVTLKAIWVDDPNTNIKVTVSPNGGMYEGSTSKKVLTGGQGTIVILSQPSKEGYEFTGWKLSGSGKLDGSIYTFGTADATITAQYRRITS